jgi:hypothetical protein
MIKQRRYPVEPTEDELRGAKGLNENSKGQNAEDALALAQSLDEEKGKRSADKSIDSRSAKRPKMRTAEMPKGRRIEVIRTLFR